MAKVDTLTIVMPVSLWNGIDGGMDNKATNARWSYWENGGMAAAPRRGSDLATRKSLCPSAASNGCDDRVDDSTLDICVRLCLPPGSRSGTVAGFTSGETCSTWHFRNDTVLRSERPHPDLTAELAAAGIGDVARRPVLLDVEHLDKLCCLCADR